MEGGGEIFDLPTSPDKEGMREKLGLDKLMASGDKSRYVWFEKPLGARTILLEEGGMVMFLVRRHSFGILYRDLLNTSYWVLNLLLH